MSPIIPFKGNSLPSYFCDTLGNMLKMINSYAKESHMLLESVLYNSGNDC